LGAVDVINKPFDPMSLAPHVEEIWAKAKGLKS
jgi:FixJ family two-component response regulator